VRRWLIILLLFSGFWAQAQDSLSRAVDSLAADSTRRAVLVQDSLRKDSILRNYRLVPDTNMYALNPIFNFTDAVRTPVQLRQWQGKESLFYGVIVLLVFFALIRNAFGRYLRDLFQTFARTSLKQKQIKEQLLQNPLPSLLMNIFFVLCAGFFLSLVLSSMGLAKQLYFWQLFMYVVAGLALVYLLKYISLKLLGWVFQALDSADAYIFIVFTTNKVLAVLILPLVVLLAFTEGLMFQSVLTVSLVIIGGCFLYRYFLAFTTVHRQLRISPLHFLLYLAAFEIIPLLLINKLLFRFLA